MKFLIRHPTQVGVRAHYGWDHALGFWAELRGPRRYREDHDALCPRYQHDRPLQSVLEFLAEKGFYGIDELHDALRWRHDQSGRVPRRLKAVNEVIQNLKDAAG